MIEFLTSVLMVVIIISVLFQIGQQVQVQNPPKQPSPPPEPPTPISPPPAPNRLPERPAFAWAGDHVCCIQCGGNADVQEELGEKRVICPGCGRSEAVSAILR